MARCAHLLEPSFATHLPPALSVSAYTLSFGGFLLLAGVLSDRYGRRSVFSGGMVMMTVWSLACSLARTDVQLIIFRYVSLGFCAVICSSLLTNRRALQGLGAAATVPSAIGVISSYFTGKDRNRALSAFGAAGAVGYVAYLVPAVIL